jgi:hypothetical protein
MGFTLFLVIGVSRIFMRIILKICLEKIRLSLVGPALVYFSEKEVRSSPLPLVKNTFGLCSEHTLKVVPL